MRRPANPVMMEGDERVEREQTTVSTSLRLPEEKSEYIKKKASEIGISQNAFIMVLIDLGIKLYECDPIISPK